MQLLRSTLGVGALVSWAACSPSQGNSSRLAESASAVPVATPDSTAALADRSRILGDTAAPVWVVIVSDFQCPFCKVWHDETFPALKQEFVDRGQIRLAYLNLPLPQHEHARTTAELALCAGAQGRFWEYHDALFDTQSEWSPLPRGTGYFASLSERAGVDSLRLRKCMESGGVQALVQADYQRSVDAKVGSTPTFIVGNDIRLAGAQPITAFREAIGAARRQALSRAGGR